jgi:hypothetical protein
VKIKRKNFYSWHYLKTLSATDFWKELCGLYNRRGHGDLTYKIASKLIYRSHSRIQKWFAPHGKEKLPISERHHLFLAVAYKRTPKNPQMPRREIDRAGMIMATLKNRHFKETGEVLPLQYWESVARIKIDKEEITGKRHRICRNKIPGGFYIENLLVKEQIRPNSSNEGENT